MARTKGGQVEMARGGALSRDRMGCMGNIHFGQENFKSF
jgi:hypothetical protein